MTERPAAPAWSLVRLGPGWRALAASLRHALAALAALAIAYWLALPEPQWAILTVYLLTQSTAGAALSKGVFRFLGTVVAAMAGLVFVKLFSQSPVLLVAAAAAWSFACYYGASRLTGFAAYGFMLAGYTGLLVTFQGAGDPHAAWSVAVNRATEISIGIACASLANAVILPAYAGAHLRDLLAQTLRELATHAAAALKGTMPVEAFMGQRGEVLAKIVTFDALRAFTQLEAREMRVDAARLRVAVREGLATVAGARSLCLRLTDLRTQGPLDAAVTLHLLPALDVALATLDRISRGPVTPAGLVRDRADLALARRRLAAAERTVEALAGSLPLAVLADMIAILRRTTRMLRALSILTRATGAVIDPGLMPPSPSGRVEDAARALGATRHREALLQGTRSGLAVLVFCLFWSATAWDQGIAGITGLALMSYQCVSTDDPGKIGWPYFRAVIAACFAAYLVMAHVYPWLEGFGMLAAFLLLVLVPLGLLIGTRRFGASAGTFTIYFVAAATTGNVYTPDPLGFANFCAGLVFGMFVCLMVARLLPVTAKASRQQAYRQSIAVLLPKAASGAMPAHRAGRDILDLLAGVLPRLKLNVEADGLFLRGMLASASVALELGPLRRAAAAPDLPGASRAALDAGLARLAALFARVPDEWTRRDADRSEGRDAIQRMWAGLEQPRPIPGSPGARAGVRAAASLRALSEALALDHAFLPFAPGGQSDRIEYIRPDRALSL